MYSDNLEDLVDVVLLMGCITDDVRDVIIQRAEEEGENVEEVLSYVETRLEQQEKDGRPIVDIDAFNNYTMSADEELEAFEFQGYEAYEVSKDAVNIVENLVNEYNVRARNWNYCMIEKSLALKEYGVFYAKFKEEEVFDPDAEYEPIMSMDELIANATIDAETFFKQYRKGIMLGRYDSIMLLLKPFKKTRLQKQLPHPTETRTVEKKTKRSIETKPKEAKQTKPNPRNSKTVGTEQEVETAKKNKKSKQSQIIVPKGSEPLARKLVDGYNQKATKWGYDLLIFNASNNTISGKFKSKSSSNGIMSGFKEGWRNGALEEEWKKILKLCDRMDLCK